MTPDHAALRIEKSVLGHPQWYLWASVSILVASVTVLRWRRRRDE